MAFPRSHVQSGRAPRAAARPARAKDDVRAFLFETARVSSEALQKRHFRTDGPIWTRHVPNKPVVQRPGEFVLVVAGGPGAQMMVAPPWGLSRAVSRAVTDRQGRPMASIRKPVRSGKAG